MAESRQQAVQCEIYFGILPVLRGELQFGALDFFAHPGRVRDCGLELPSWRVYRFGCFGWASDCGHSFW